MEFFQSFLDKITGVVSTEMLIGLTIFSVVAFIGTLLAIPAILVRLPQDYFLNDQPHHWIMDRHPIIRGIFLALKNAVGLIFLLAGFAMLFLPGQGILTMIIGLSLLNFPGKRKLEKKIIGHPKIFPGINALREKFGKPPFILSHQD